MTIEKVLHLIQNVLKFPLFTIKSTEVTMTSLFMFFIVMLTFTLLSRLFIRMMMTRILAKMKLDDSLSYTFTRITHYLMLVIGAIVAFQFIGLDLSGLLVIFGFLSVGIGFGLQNLTSNFISGLILLFERPIKVGDRISIGDLEGDVAEINIRSTTVRSLNNISIIVPNSEFISGTVVNWTHDDPKVRLDINVGVSYDSDLERVIRSLKEVADENSEVLKQPEPEVLFMEFGDSAWNLRLRIWIENPKRHPYVRSAIHCAIVHKFRENAIEIPFPQRDLHLRSPLPIPLKVTNSHS